MAQKWYDNNMTNLELGPDGLDKPNGKKKLVCDNTDRLPRAQQGKAGHELDKYLTDADKRFADYTAAYVLADCTIAAIKQHVKLPPNIRSANSFDSLRREQCRIATDLLRTSLMANAKRAARRETKSVIATERAKEPYKSPEEAAAIIGLTSCALEHLVNEHPAIADKYSLVIGHKGRPRKDGTRAAQRRWRPDDIISFIREVQE